MNYCHVLLCNVLLTKVLNTFSYRALVRKADGKEGWLPMSILMQTALCEDNSSTGQHKAEDSHFRRE